MQHLFHKFLTVLSSNLIRILKNVKVFAFIYICFTPLLSISICTAGVQHSIKYILTEKCRLITHTTSNHSTEEIHQGSPSKYRGSTFLILIRNINKGDQVKTNLKCHKVSFHHKLLLLIDCPSLWTPLEGWTKDIPSWWSDSILITTFSKTPNRSVEEISIGLIRWCAKSESQLLSISTRDLHRLIQPMCVCVCVTPEVASQNLEDAQSGTTNMYTCILISAVISIRF